MLTNMRKMTEEESKRYKESLDNIYKPTGLKINIVREKEDNNMFNDAKVWNDEEEDDLEEIVDTKYDLEVKLLGIEERLDNLMEEFTSISSEMKYQISEIREMINSL